MAATAGARRSSTAYGRFLVWANDAEIIVAAANARRMKTPTRFSTRCRRHRSCTTSARFGFANVVVELADGTRPSFLAFQPAVDRDGRSAGNFPRQGAARPIASTSEPDEVSLSFLVAERFGLSVGDELRLLAVDEAGRASSRRAG